MGLTALIFFSKEGVLRIYITLKNAWYRPGFNQRTLRPTGLKVLATASTLTITPPRRLLCL
jgi:hypothetical protein